MTSAGGGDASEDLGTRVSWGSLLCSVCSVWSSTERGAEEGAAVGWSSVMLCSRDSTASEQSCNQPRVLATENLSGVRRRPRRSIRHFRFAKISRRIKATMTIGLDLIVSQN